MIELAGQPVVQVTLTLQGERVSIQATTGGSKDGWALIRTMCLEGALAAHTEWLKLQAAAPPQVVLPTLAPPYGGIPLRGNGGG